MNLECIRSAFRGLLGYKSPIYRLASYLLAHYQILRHESWRTMKQLERIKETSGEETALVLRGLQYPFIVRPGTDDVHSVVNNAIREEYGQFSDDFLPHVIIDAGAYIGDTAAYFLSRFPACRVVALEPNNDSFHIAERNLIPYGDRVVLLKAALWSEVTTLNFGGIQTGAAIGKGGIKVATETVDSLMSKLNLNFIDILKMDIEGAESVVIPSGLGGWLDKVGTILLETHGTEIEESLIPLLTKANFSCKRLRNVWYCVRFCRSAEQAEK